MNDTAPPAPDADLLLERARRRERIVSEVKERPEHVLRPVGWMLSPELVANLRSIFRKVIDPRRWMWMAGGHAHVEDGDRARGGRWARIQAAAAPAASAVQAPPRPEELCAEV